MHEMGMLKQLADIADEYAVKNDWDEVKYINLEIGELSGVYPQLFTEYFPIVAKKYPSLKEAELKVHIVPGEGLCSDCQTLYNVMKFEGQCPHCHSRVKTVLGGRDIRLLSIAS